MTVTAGSFRVDFPEFGDTAVYPDSQINFWLNIAANFVSKSRWGKSYDIGVESFVGHQIALESKAQAEAAFGAVPGMSEGAVNNKTTDKVSIGFDAAAVANEGAGYWNLTIYGSRYWKILQMMGAGPVQVGSFGSGCGVAWCLT